LRLPPAPSDDKIEALIGSLMPVVYVEAMKSFDEARRMTVPGQPVELRDVHISQGTRLCRAFAELTVALAKHRGKAQRLVIEHHHIRCFAASEAGK
jgi:hypothetical protein